MIATVAVVDDDARILDALELLFVAEGWAVETYTTGEAFLRALENNNAPQCLVLDPYLPGINGAAVTYAIINGDTGTPIIVLTARPTGSVTREIMNAGARTLFTKPVSTEDLIDEVNAAINSHQYGRASSP